MSDVYFLKTALKSQVKVPSHHYRLKMNYCCLKSSFFFHYMNKNDESDNVCVGRFVENLYRGRPGSSVDYSVCKNPTITEMLHGETKTKEFVNRETNVVIQNAAVGALLSKLPPAPHN